MAQRLCVFGEVLFDIFPDGKQVLGGAPFNVAWHLQAFGQAPLFISRVGDDEEGRRINDAMDKWGLSTADLQIDQRLPTGRVSIELNDGEPSYDIVEPVAYDAIEQVSSHHTDCELLYHGSLALRNSASRKALQDLRDAGSATVFVDVNLRDPWWDRQQVLDMLQHADWVKLNADEFALLYQEGSSTMQRLQGVIADFKLTGVILTQGDAGAQVLTLDGAHYQVTPKKTADLVDTVGAGDAFAAVTILGIANAWTLDETLQRAQQFASALVGQRGATVADAGFYQAFMQQWGMPPASN